MHRGCGNWIASEELANLFLNWTDFNRMNRPTLLFNVGRRTVESWKRREIRFQPLQHAVGPYHARGCIVCVHGDVFVLMSGLDVRAETRPIGHYSTE